MAFKLGDIVIDRLQYGFAEDFSGNPLYVLTQLQEGTIEITSEPKESRDANGTLIKKFYTGKSGTLTATNAMLNTNIMAATSGADAIIASQENQVTMPKIVTIKKGTTDYKLADYVEGTAKLNVLYTNGTLGKAYTLGESASETNFHVDTESENTLQLPTEDSDDIVQYLLKYDRKVKEGVVIKNRADKFPGTVKLTLKALAVDPCSADTLRAAYIVLPSFQVSPDITIGLTTESTLEYTGDLQVAYCGTEKTLYEFYWASDDEEEE